MTTVDGVGDERTRALFFHATAGGQPVEEAQLLRSDDDGLVTEPTLYGRPRPGVTAVMTGIAGAPAAPAGPPGRGRGLP